LAFGCARENEVSAVFNCAAESLPFELRARPSDRYTAKFAVSVRALLNIFRAAFTPMNVLVSEKSPFPPTYSMFSNPAATDDVVCAAVGANSAFATSAKVMAPTRRSINSGVRELACSRASLRTSSSTWFANSNSF
jgi:hypothetical protein